MYGLYEHMSLISCYTSVLITTDILHYIMLYFIVLMLMNCELNFYHTYFANDFDMTVRCTLRLTCPMSHV